MLKKKKILLILLLLIIPNVQAKQINHFKTITKDQINDTNTYNSSQILLGNEIKTNSHVKGVSIILGNEVNIKGTQDYAIILANNLTLKNKINKDSLIISQNLKTNKNYQTNRDTLIIAQNVTLQGTYNRDIIIYANNVTLKNANIKGNIKINSDKLKVEETTTIDKTLSYKEDADYNISNKAKIQNKQKLKTKEKTNKTQNIIINNITSELSKILIFIILTLIIPKLFTKIKEKYKQINFTNFSEAFGKGAIIIIITPLIALLLLITGIGAPISIITIILYIILMYLSDIITGYTIGYKIMQKLNKQDNTLIQGTIGMIILCMLKLVPILGTIITIISLSFSLGTLYQIYKTNK